MNSRMTESGTPAAIDADCKACRPPASSSAPATTPSPSPQKIRNCCGGCGSPIDSMVQITSVPESEEVTNHEMSRKVISAATDQTYTGGKSSSMVVNSPKL